MKEVKTGREKEVADARRRLGDQRLLAFLRACRDCDDILACKLVNDEMDEGKSLDESFYTGSEYGYGLAVKECEDDTFDISFGCQVAPTAGDGGRCREGL
jgi:hypothetical protein